MTRLFSVRAPANIALTLALAALLCACGPSSPDPAAEAALRADALVQQKDALTVRVRVLTAAETKRFFGGSTAGIGVQPVWVEVRNDGDVSVRYLPILTDPDYFAPQEVAQQLHGWFTPDTNELIDRTFEHSAMPSFIASHSTASGYVFTQADGGLKLLNIGLFSPGKSSWRFRFIARVPGREYAVQRVDFRGLYSPEQIKDLSLEELRTTLESLPCCVTDKRGVGSGDPLNLVVIGNGIDAAFPFTTRGWRMNEPVGAASSLKMAKAFLLNSAYDTAPVSPLYVFGRPQDVAFQKARSTVSLRNHLRLWLAPFTVGGHNVWIGQISRDIGIKLTTKSWYLTTHRISPFVDQERDYLLQDLLMSGMVERFGFVKGVGESTADKPRMNLTDDPYFTDGLRLVVFLGEDPHLPSDITALGWERSTQ